MTWQNLNWLDYTILVIIGFSTLVSLARGFVREALSLVIWVGAFWIAYRFGKPFTEQFLGSIQAEEMRLPIAYAILFLGVLILGAVINYAISRLVYTTGLSGTDRVLGLVFGMARGVFLIAVIALVVPMTAVNQSDWWQKSQLIPQFEGLALYLRAMLPEKLDQLPILSNEKKELNQISVNHPETAEPATLSPAVPPAPAIPSTVAPSSVVTTPSR